MSPHQQLVRTFHQRFGLTINDTPTLSPGDNRLRVNLNHEEAMELWEAEEVISLIPKRIGGISDEMIGAKIAIADALGDLAYVVLGGAVTYGFELGYQADPDYEVNGIVAPGLIAANGEFARYISSGLLNLARGELYGMIGVITDAADYYSIPLDPVFREIHRSNMSKLWTDAEVHADGSDIKFRRTIKVPADQEGRCWLVKNKDGKALKSPSYSPANLAPILQ